MLKKAAQKRLIGFHNLRKEISNLESGYNSKADMFIGERQKLFAEGYYSESLNLTLRGIGTLGSIDTKRIISIW